MTLRARVARDFPLPILQETFILFQFTPIGYSKVIHYVYNQTLKNNKNTTTDK